MKTLIVMLFGLILAPTLLAQEDRPDLLPRPIGGIKAIQEKIAYPKIALDLRFDGRVFVHASIDEYGNVADATIIKGIGAGCDEAALNAVKQTKFTPAMNDQKPYKAKILVPVLFKLS